MAPTSTRVVGCPGSPVACNPLSPPHLHIVLAKHPLTRLIRLSHGLCRFGLADGHQAGLQWGGGAKCAGTYTCKTIKDRAPCVTLSRWQVVDAGAVARQASPQPMQFLQCTGQGPPGGALAVIGGTHRARPTAARAGFVHTPQNILQGSLNGTLAVALHGHRENSLGQHAHSLSSDPSMPGHSAQRGE